MLLLTLLVLLLLVGAVLAQPGGPGPAVWYTVEEGMASGGGYRLTGLAWQFSGIASGGKYRLLGPAAPALRGNGCCCTYLPCIVRRW
ncbi:MAG: hypothetical protein QHJ81_01095 [Anaerolineae bacterium]|nr:hypothetical protein [Anaerolineae bacterium]